MLLFDEPVNGLDPEGALWVRGVFRRLAAEGRTVFVSSRLMSETANTADQLVVTGADAAGIGELAHRHRVRIIELTTRTASLEGAFMELTADSVEYGAGDRR